MAPNCRHTTSQKKAEEDAIREEKTKNLQTAAAEFKVPYHTLRWQAQNLTKPHSKAHKNSQLLTEGQEATICDWAKYLAMMGHPLSKCNLCAKVSELSKKLKAKKKLTGKDKGPSKTWVKDFLTCHSELKLGCPTGIDPKRMQMFNYTTVNHHFKLLDNFLKSENIPWDNVYNMDEKGIQLGGGRKCDNMKYLFSWTAKAQVKAKSDQLKLVTVIECMCVDGTSLKPGFVFSGS
ncbi:uncharacterized protein BJ212DRAFT_1482604 [Suillus subaureus]|uniref:HTH CENPB-type domain-containing protein n=1 Tax=Suillus subaureus TaxID=48587 RepID=A0A9P7E703_9AGAM|nr:uncharacterized protein BJ212DRAFT_1482604 [Suillus subaureus]KAG1813133.1 hypothetical protein BJ212DRAFT_1482604 [Suillus subaureus]